MESCGKQCEVGSGLVYHMTQEGERIVVPTLCKKQVLALQHDHAVVGHFKVERTFQRLREHFWWPHMSKDAKAWCDSCPRCQLARPHAGVNPGVTPIPVSAPLELMGMDVMGPFPTAPGGFRVLLVVTPFAHRPIVVHQPHRVGLVRCVQLFSSPHGGISL